MKNGVISQVAIPPKHVTGSAVVENLDRLALQKPVPARTYQCVPDLEIRTHTFPGGKTAVTFRYDTGQGHFASYCALNPGEIIIKTSISAETADWFHVRTNQRIDEQYIGREVYVVFNPRQPRQMSIIDPFSLQQSDATAISFSNAEQKERFDEAVIPLLTTQYSTVVGQIGKGTCCIVEVTTEIANAGSTPAENNGKSTRGLISQGDLIPVLSGCSDKPVYASSRYLKARVISNGIQGFPSASMPDIDTMTTACVGSGKNAKKDADNIIAHFVMKLRDCSSFEHPPREKTGEGNSYSDASTELQKRTVDYPSALKNYLLDTWTPQTIRQTEQRYLKRLSKGPTDQELTAKHITDIAASSISEKVIEKIFLPIPLEERRQKWPRLLAEYEVITDQLAKAAEDLIVRTGYHVVSQSNPVSSQDTENSLHVFARQQCLGVIAGVEKEGLADYVNTNSHTAACKSAENSPGQTEKILISLARAEFAAGIEKKGRNALESMDKFDPNQMDLPSNQDCAKLFDFNRAYREAEAQVDELKNSDQQNALGTDLNSSLPSVLRYHVRQGERVPLGAVVVREDIASSSGPFQTLPGYKTCYPKVVVEALGNLYTEYNSQFAALVIANREFPTDYQYCFAPDGAPRNYFVQIDMMGLPHGFLEAASQRTEPEVREILRRHIFEIENSLAGYVILENICQPVGETSCTFFRREFRAGLNELRLKHRKPIALLAVTEQKYEAMKQGEFGKATNEPLSPTEVMQLSGFDRFFSPSEFEAYMKERGDDCEYLLYVRSSDPVAKLKDPTVTVDVPLLQDKRLRRIIKAHTITFNIDAPGAEAHTRINDTKSYLGPMGMGYMIESLGDIFTPEFSSHLSEGGDYFKYTGERLAPAFVSYLTGQGLNARMVEFGEQHLRAKPERGSYGCYGHLHGSLAKAEFRKELSENIKNRGGYVIQPEMQMAQVTDAVSGKKYAYIDRNFLRLSEHGPQFLGGFRSLMPVESHEAKRGRIHGSATTLWTEIYPAYA